MKHDYKVALTKEDLYKIVFDEVCSRYNYPREQAKTLLEEDLEFRHLVSEHLSPHLYGKPTPIKPPKTAVRGEAERCFRLSLFFGAYPKHINKDCDKLKHLQALLSNDSIDESRYLEFADVLDVKEKDVMSPLEVCEFV